MKCYRCSNTLTKNNLCTHCGAKVEVYKKVLSLSNTYYNMGLAKAQIRDLTGACELLRQSVHFNKKNTDARNLLGLVYFEMGEAVDAMSQWIISKNLQPEDNRADYYIERLHTSAQKLETMNQSIKKYNLALGYVKQGNEDVAVIQLKKVLNNHPRLVKGHLLLALLYMKKGDYERAKKPVIKALKIDSNNPLAKRYLKMLEAILGQKLGAVYESMEFDRKKLLSSDVDRSQTEKEFLKDYDLVQPQTGRPYRESNSGFMTVVNVIIGLIVGVGFSFFLLMPAKEKAMNSQHNKEILVLHSQMDTLNTDKKILQGEIDKITKEKETLSSQINEAGSANTAVLQDYDILLTVVTEFQKQEFMNAAAALKTIGNTEHSPAFQGLYQLLQPQCYKEAANGYYTQGKNEFYKANTIEAWQNVIQLLGQVFQYSFMEVNYVDAVDLLGKAYEKQYELALTQSIETAGSCKETALLKLAELIEQVFANTPGIDAKAAQNAQDAITRITSK